MIFLLRYWRILAAGAAVLAVAGALWAYGSRRETEGYNRARSQYAALLDVVRKDNARKEAEWQKRSDDIETKGQRELRDLQARADAALLAVRRVRVNACPSLPEAPRPAPDSAPGATPDRFPRADEKAAADIGPDLILLARDAEQTRISLLACQAYVTSLTH